MEKQYLSISQSKCFVAIEKNFLDSISDLGDITVKRNIFSNVIWEYQQKKITKRSFMLYLDVFVSDVPIKFSNNGVLMIKNFQDYNFGIFTNNTIHSYKALTNKQIPISEKIFKKLPPDLITGVFSGMYKKGKKPILCLDIAKCCSAYKHFIK